ncbi:MAG: MFS transporter [Thermoflexales bacterium]|nr:MFS transporter [Thermoflexales bacterium]
MSTRIASHSKLDAAGRSPDLAPFFVVWSGQAFSLLGSQLVQFALVWWLTKTSGSATVLAMASLTALLPPVLIGPFAGALVDRWNRRAVMIAADSLIALATGGLALLYAAGVVQIWHIYALMFIRALGSAFHWPAMQASTSLMVPERHLSRIAGLNQSLNGLINIVSPLLGAMLLEALPMQGVLAIDVLSAGLAVAPLFFVHIPQPAPSLERGTQFSVLADVRDGLRFVWQWTGLALLVAIIGLLHLVAVPAFALVPILVTDRLNGGAIQLAWLQSALGIGMVVGGLTLSVWGGFKRRVVTVTLALVSIGAGLTVMGLLPATALLLAVGAMFGIGFMLPMVSGSIQAVLQATVPPDMQGRVFTLVTSGSSAMSPLGMLIAGPFADARGVQLWYLLTGLLMSVVGVGMFFIPALSRIEEKHACPPPTLKG